MDSNHRSPVCGELGAPGPGATRPRAIVKPRNARSLASTSSASDLRMPGAPFTRTKPPSSWRSASATPSIWRPPFAGPEAVLAYLARYTHRVAISNSRLVAPDERGVTLLYKDYRRSGQARYRTMTLRADEFIRRFLLHVLPKGFHRIRHYGLLASAGCKANIARQEADGRPNAGDRSAGSARHGRSAHHDRSSPVVPLLWRPHDHCRGLCARRRTARSPVLRPRHQNRNPMRLCYYFVAPSPRRSTPFSTSRHCYLSDCEL